MRAILLLSLFSPLGAFEACATHGGSDSETHFLCGSDAECRARGEGEYCVDRRCQNTPPVTVSITVSGKGAGGGDTGAPAQGGSGAASSNPDGGLVVTAPREAGTTDGGCVIAASVQRPEILATDELLVVDRSASAATPFTGSKARPWDVAVAGIDLFTSNPVSEGVSLGLQYYPASSDAGDACTVAEPIVVPAQFAAGGVISASLAAQRLGGAPSLRAAYQQALDAMKASASAGKRAFVTLVMTAPDTQCGAPDVAALAQQANDAMPSVGTYVIGVGEGDLSSLSAIAAAGGTEQAMFATNPEAARDVFRALVQTSPDKIPCQVPFPQFIAGQPINPDRVNLVYRSGDGPEVTIPRLASAADCAANGDRGWYYVDASATQLQADVCQTSCDEYQGTDLSLVFGCRPIEIR